jgi:RNA polymerase sigma factor (sigma-70 family)
MEDAGLLKQYAANRDANAFAELVRRYAGMVYGTSLRLTKNGHDAEDVAQECFLELARNANNITASLPGWLHKVARRRTIDFMRKTSIRARYEDTAMSDKKETKELNWEEIAPHIDEALENIPEKLRTPLILHYLSGKSQDDIASDLNLSQGTVSRQLEKGVKYLRSALKKAGVISSVTVLTALIAENAICSAPATLMTALGKMAIAGIGASAISGTATVGGITATSGGSAASSGGITTLIASAKVKIVAVLTAGVLILGGIAIIRNKKSVSQEPLSNLTTITPIMKTVEKAKEKPAGKSIVEIMKASGIVEKRFGGHNIWIPGLDPQFTQENKDGPLIAKYINGKIIQLDQYNPLFDSNSHTIRILYSWFFSYDEKGLINKVFLQTAPNHNCGIKHPKIEYIVSGRDESKRAKVVDGVLTATNWTIPFRVELKYNPQGYLQGYSLFNKPETVHFEYTLKYHRNGTRITGDDLSDFSHVLGFIEFYANMNGSKKYRDKVLGL